ncbi:MAG TPA: hypothetical protein VLT58_08135, partial [Polyangia bacterium]|nr:hypothetical protein [Polyangia bacterium]
MTFNLRLIPLLPFLGAAILMLFGRKWSRDTVLAVAAGAIGLAWLLLALPLAGFLINGALSLWAPRAKAAVSLVGPAVLVAAFGVALAIFAALRQA